ncbi:hypothetical protein V8C26DRAFT_434361 [Trichoderma gracile]
MAPASLLTLPNELLYKICENLCPHCANLPLLSRYGYQLAIKTTALSCLSKTCRVLREIAQPILYHYVDTIKYWPFLRSIIARPDLAAHVRALQYTGDTRFEKDAVLRAHRELLDHMTGIHETYTGALERANTLESILTRLPNVEELHIYMGYKYVLALRARLKSIRRLGLYCVGCHSNLDQMGNLLSVMPHLEDLTIPINFQPAGTYMLPITELRSLDLGCSSWNVLGLTTIIDHNPKLERFRCIGATGWGLNGDDLPWPWMQRTLYPLRKTLKHVNFSSHRFYYPDQSSLRHYFGSFRKLDGLETLWMKVGGIIPKRWSSKVTRFPADATEMVELLPESLRLVYFRGLTQGWHGIEMLAQAIEGGHFPRLKTVVVQQSGATLRKSRRALAAVGVSCESITAATGGGRHLFPEGGYWNRCFRGHPPCDCL